MKKQILFLAFFILAMMAGSLTSFGQTADNDYLNAAPSGCAATPLTCVGDPLHPTPGVEYTYSISATNAGTVHWFVTDVADVMAAYAITSTIDPGDGTKYLLTSDAVYNDGANTSLSIDLTWQMFDGTANKVLLVAYVEDAATCTNNIEVFRIEPANAFSLDIAGVLDDGSVGAAECVSPVVSAQYDGSELKMDYGKNYVFYTVTAANWLNEWKPTFDATGGTTTSQIGTPEWAYSDEADGASSIWHPATDNVQASHYAAPNGFVGQTGACIVVRVPVTHGANEIDVAGGETVNLAVDGEMKNPQTNAYDGIYPDLEDGTPCAPGATSDNADYTLNPRPNITTTVVGDFEPKN